MNMKDVKIDTYTNSSRWVDMRLTHEPTGKTVSGCEQSKFFLKKRLIEELEEKIKEDK